MQYITEYFIVVGSFLVLLNKKIKININNNLGKIVHSSCFKLTFLDFAACRLCERNALYDEHRNIINIQCTVQSVDSQLKRERGKKTR